MNSNYSMSDKSYSGYGYSRSQGCGCGGQPQQTGMCTLSAPMPYVPACTPAPFHRAACQSADHFTVNTAYGRW